jgi:hypothetical protein
MKKIAIAVLLGLCAASLAQDAVEPYYIKTDVLGETIETYKQNHQNEKQDCVINPAAGAFHNELAPGLQSCVTLGTQQPMTYAEAQVKSRQVSFDDGKLYELVYVFDSAWITKESYGMYYDILLIGLTDKFGKPKLEDSDFPTLTGSNVKNQTATWNNGVSTIRLHKFLGNPYTSILTFSLDNLREDARHKMLAAKKPKSDM